MKCNTYCMNMTDWLGHALHIASFDTIHILRVTWWLNFHTRCALDFCMAPKVQTLDHLLIRWKMRRRWPHAECSMLAYAVDFVARSDFLIAVYLIIRLVYCIISTCTIRVCWMLYYTKNTTVSTYIYLIVRCLGKLKLWEIVSLGI